MNRQEDAALMRTSEQTQELDPTGRAAAAQYEIQGALVMAHRLPRDEDTAFVKLMKATNRKKFAELAEYSFPRGNTTVTGPSVNIAREAARCWGNIRWGLDLIRDDNETRTIRGWAWDLETNTYVSADDHFRKLIQRRSKQGGGTQWVKPDERDLRELTNRHGSILVRNCLLQLIPRDIIDSALDACRATVQKDVEEDPEAARKRLFLAFSELGVMKSMLEKYLGHPIEECSPKEIAELRTIYTSIRDGNSKWTDYSASPDPKGKAGKSKSGKTQEKSQGSLNLDKVKTKQDEKPASDG